ncbi:hypothetical protein SRABI128_05056 [Microbacterium sp. Bi128]|nr:hypothetical protein SRABI128_05056 [Microbacterium sp. Bi128]
MSLAVRGQHADATLPAAGHDFLDLRAEDNGQMEQGTRRRPHGLGVVDVHARAGQDDSVGAGGVGRPQHGAGVAGVPDLAQDGNQPRAGVEHVLKADVQEAADGNDALWGDGVRHRSDHFVGCEVRVGSLGQLLQLRVAVQAGLGGVHLIDDAGLPRGDPLPVQDQGLTDRLRAFG